MISRKKKNENRTEYEVNNYKTRETAKRICEKENREYIEKELQK